jgi:FkbM family methyltransferase
MLIPFNKITEKYSTKIHGVLHVGAHNCEELLQYTNYGLTNNNIIWIEANPKLVEENLNIDNTRIIKNFICCDKDEGKTKLNISNNGQSSSIFEFGSHAKSYRSVKYVDSVEVNNCRIDSMYEQEKIPKNFANFVNMDIQGAELLALKGMGDLLNYFDYAYLEVNNGYVYKNCALVDEIDEYLSKYNFVREETVWTNANWGDAMYIKK